MLVLVLLPVVFIGVLVLLFKFRRSTALFPIAIAIWPAAFWYNQWILSRCSGDCGIRIDLIFVVPLVLLITVLAAGEAYRRRRSGKLD
jgi:hypothetical protein